MKSGATEAVRFLQDLMGRRVRDASGKSIGRVYDVVAEREGNDLAVVAIVVGPRSWLQRFGWTKTPHGREIRWEDLNRLSPDITLRVGAWDRE